MIQKSIIVNWKNWWADFSSTAIRIINGLPCQYQAFWTSIHIGNRVSRFENDPFPSNSKNSKHQCSIRLYVKKGGIAQENVKTRKQGRGKTHMPLWVHSMRLSGHQQSSLFFSTWTINQTLCSDDWELALKNTALTTHAPTLAFLTFLSLNCTWPLLPEESMQIDKITHSAHHRCPFSSTVMGHTPPLLAKRHILEGFR